ncbi:hypothetical protein ACO1O0_001974 [Amphichorda felina]
MESVEQYHIVFGSLILSFVTYWSIHQGLEHALRVLAPEAYRTLNQNRLEGISVFMSMVMRAVLGSLVTVPSCIIAAQQTPWEYGHGMNIAGSVCMISQAVPFVSELQLLLDTNVEVLLHHLVCLVVMANITAFPQVHMIKGLYLFFASQLGDVSVAVYKCLKLLGRKPSNSWTAYLAKMWSTLLLLFSKTGVALCIAAKVLKSPSHWMEWMWVFCMLFFALYNLEGTGFNFIYLGLAKKLPQGGPAGLVFLNRIRITRFNMMVAASTIAATLVKTAAYGFLLDHEMTCSEHVSAWIESITWAGASCVLIGPATAFLEVLLEVKPQHEQGEWLVIVKNKELRSRIGTHLLAVCLVSDLLYPGLLGLDRAASAGSAAFAFLLWDTGVRIGIYASIGESERGPKGNGLKKAKENGSEKPKQNVAKQISKKSPVVNHQDFWDAGYQLRMIWANLAILLLGFALPLPIRPAKLHLAMLLSQSMVQCLSEIIMPPRPMDGNSRHAKAMRAPRAATSRLGIMQLCLAFAATAWFAPQSCLFCSRDNILAAGLLMGVVASAASQWIPMMQRETAKHEKPEKQVPPQGWLSKMAKEVSHPRVYAPALLFIMQTIEIYLVWKGQDYSGPLETSAGFRNVVKVMGSWVAIGGTLAVLELSSLATWYCV